MNEKIGSLSEKDIDQIHAVYNSYIDDGQVCQNYGIVAVLDVLGWKNNIKEQDITTYFSLINRLRSYLLDTCLRCSSNGEKPNVRISTLSDTIVILIDGNSPYCEINIFNHIACFITNTLKKGFMFRGAISRGLYYTNSLDNSFVGEPYYEAAYYAEKTEWAGIIITDSLAEALLVNNSLEQLEQLNIIEYKNIPYKQNIKPTKNNLVLVPNQEVWYDIKTNEKNVFDFISIYEKLMEGESLKLENTRAFYNFLNSKNFYHTTSTNPKSPSSNQ